MSSIESMILEIEEDYNQILKRLEVKIDLKDEIHKFKEVTENELFVLLRRTVRFQRKLEYVLDQMEKLILHFPRGVEKGIEVEEKEYAETLGITVEEALRRLEPLRRLNKITTNIITALSTDKKIDSIKFLISPDSYYKEDIGVAGVTTNLKVSIEYFLAGNLTAARRECYCAYFGLKKIKVDLVEMQEELRYISAITTYPIEMKIKLKEQLVFNAFESVAISFEEAETNIEQEHFKDCISRCRDAVEIFISQIREKETGEKTERHFATDLAKIVKHGVFDLATQRLAQGVYSFLSLKGSHKYEESKISIYDAETALKESYSLVEMLLKKYLAYKKSK